MRKNKMVQLLAGSLIAACSVFGTAGLAGAEEDAPQPPPGGPNIPDNPVEEGLPVPIPGGGG